MTLEEHIADEKQRADSLIVSASKLKPDELVVRMVYERGADEHREKAELLEELRVLRKAFAMCAGSIEYENYFLQKARENNDNSTND